MNEPSCDVEQEFCGPHPSIVRIHCSSGSRRRQSLGRSLERTEDRRDQAVERLGARHVVQPIVDHADNDSVVLAPAAGGRGVNATKIGAVRQSPVHIQAHVLADSTQQIGSRLGALPPECMAGEETIRQARHSFAEGGHDAPGQSDFVGRVLAHPRRPRHVGAVLQHRHKAVRAVPRASCPKQNSVEMLLPEQHCG